MYAWNGNPMGLIDPEHLHSPIGEYQDILILDFCRPQPCTSSEIPTDAGAMLFNYDVTVKKLAKKTRAP